MHQPLTSSRSFAIQKLNQLVDRRHRVTISMDYFDMLCTQVLRTLFCPFNRLLLMHL